MSGAHPGHFEFSMAAGVEMGMQAVSPGRRDANESYRNGDYAAADEKFRTALGNEQVVHLAYIPRIIDGNVTYDEVFKTIPHDVESGRTFIDWANSTAADILDMPLGTRQAATIEAIARTRRGIVLLEQDQHQIVSESELAEAKELLKVLEEAQSLMAIESSETQDSSLIMRRMAKIVLPPSPSETAAA